MNEDLRGKLEFRGGKLGACVPFLSLLVFMTVLLLLKQVSLRTVWVAGFFAMCTSLLFVKSQKRFNKAAIHGLVDPMFSTFIMIFFLAGIFSQLLRQSGLINGLLYVSTAIDLNSGYLPIIAFLTCVIISTASGTTGGTVAAVTPIMFPLGVQLGCNPALMLGAIISGSFFGDNLAPISDTTIASATSMNSDILPVVRTRLKYSLIAGLFAATLYIFVGLKNAAPLPDQVLTDSSHLVTLIMLAVPVIMVVLMIRGMELIPVLLVCNMIALAINLGMGFLAPESLLSVKGPIISGIDGMLGVVVFSAFVFILVRFTRESGIFDLLVHKLTTGCSSPRQVEAASAGIVVAGCLLTGISTVAIVIAGPVVNRLFRSFGIDRRRGANVMDAFACGVCGILPYNSAMLNMYGLATSSGFLPEDFSPLQVLPYSFHCILILVVFGVSIATGWDRKFESYADEAESCPPEAVVAPKPETAGELPVQTA